MASFVRAFDAFVGYSAYVFIFLVRNHHFAVNVFGFEFRHNRFNTAKLRVVQRERFERRLVTLNQLDRRPTKRQALFLTVVGNQLFNPQNRLAHKACVNIGRSAHVVVFVHMAAGGITAVDRFVIGRVQQFVNPRSLRRGNRHNANPQKHRQHIDINAVTVFFDHINHVKRNDHRNAEFRKL